jgi:hypothetical protein
LKEMWSSSSALTGEGRGEGKDEAGGERRPKPSSTPRVMKNCAVSCIHLGQPQVQVALGVVKSKRHILRGGLLRRIS